MMETTNETGVKEVVGSYPYDAIVVLPYTRRERENFPEGSNPQSTHRLSHFSSRAVLAGWELYDQGKAPLFILPGEQKDPSTSELEHDFLLRKGVPDIDIIEYPNLNGTPEQLDPILKLQKESGLGRVLVVSFEFHKERVEELMKRWGIDGDIAEVEQTHVKYLQSLAQKNDRESTVNRDTLINLPQLEPIKKAEHGIARKFMSLDKPFGRYAPFARFAKLIMGPTITDIDKLGLVRVEKARKAILEMKQKLQRKNN
jgi:hypothetical protein